MPTLSSPASIFEHTFDPVAGFTLEPAANVIFNSKFAAALAHECYQGRIVHINSAGEFEPGVNGYQMPMMVLPQSAPYGALRTLSPYWAGVGKEPISALVFNRGYEVATTEYKKDDTWAINNLVTAPVGLTLGDADTAGVLTNNVSGTALTTPYKSGGTTKTIVGMVSAVPKTYKNQNTVLRVFSLVILGEAA